MDQAFAYVSSADGEAKRWQYDSQPYEVGATGRKLFPVAVAEHARAFFTPRTGFEGDGVCTIVVEPFDGEVDLVPADRPALEFGGKAYSTLEELIAAAQAAAVAKHEKATAKAQANPPTVPGADKVLTG